MRRGARIPALLAIAAVAAAAMIAYSPVRASYVRHAATRHVAQADAMRQTMSSPVAQQSLKGASDPLMFALMRPHASPEEISTLDAALVSVMTQMQAVPPPAQPVYLVASYEPSAVAGAPFRLRVAIHSEIPQAFLAVVTAEFSVGNWTSGRIVQRLDRAIGATPFETEFVFTLPPDVSGRGDIRVSGAYRLDPTGEGQDYPASPKAGLPPVMVTRSADAHR